MEFFRAFVLAVVQGLTEFLPISSSGHLILVPALTGWDDQGLGFDIAVHLGTLAAVIAYFRRELATFSRTLFDPTSPESQLAWMIIVASIPLGLAGLAFYDVVETELRSVSVIAAASAGFGILLWASDRFARGSRDEYALGWREVIAIGVVQALALIPGTSRSGITMTAALALGLSRQAAGRLSFLLAIPAIAMAASWQLVQFVRDPEPVAWSVLALATVVSALTAFAAISLFLRLIERVGMGVFAAYRIVLAGVIVLMLS